MTITDACISTPGEILKEEFLDPLGISQYRLAKAIGKPQSAVSDIVHNRRSITPEMAFLIGKALGTTPDFLAAAPDNLPAEDPRHARLPPSRGVGLTRR